MGTCRTRVITLFGKLEGATLSKMKYFCVCEDAHGGRGAIHQNEVVYPERKCWDFWDNAGKEEVQRILLPESVTCFVVFFWQKNFPTIL